jgi:hypothetical protein
VLGGLNDGDTVITTGSSALRDGDRIVLPGGAGGAAGAAAAHAGRRRRGGRSGARHAAAPGATPLRRARARRPRSAAPTGAARRVKRRARRRRTTGRQPRRWLARRWPATAGSRRGAPPTRRPRPRQASGNRLAPALSSGVSHMSIPRLAIHRPVTMFMISGVITLLGVISLTRCPST